MSLRHSLIETRLILRLIQQSNMDKKTKQLPTREPDIILEQKIKCWQIDEGEKHFVCAVDLKNGKQIVYAQTGQFIKNRVHTIFDRILTGFIKEFAE